MKTALITIKTEPKIKQAAQKIAADLGLSLSSILNGYVHQLIKNKTVYFSNRSEENPSEYLINEIKQAEEDYKNGDYYSFDNVQDAIKFLDTAKNED
jgi:addiction module RelB/DinJ family antitoxin